MGLIQNKVTVSQPNSHVVVKNAGGLRGLTGEQGVPGPQGVPGEAATVTAGTTTTLPAGSDATVQNVGSTSAAIFNFGIPKGDTGETGAAATISVGTTTTLEPGEDATVTNSGTSSAAVFDFGIPKGAKGDTGSQGPAGADGFSPTATVSKTGDTATITVTDKDGTTTAQISDGVTPTIDPALSPTSENPVQNKVVTNALAGKADKPIVVSSLPATGTAGQEYFVDDRYNTVTELKGDTQQTTYSGKNLANIRGDIIKSGAATVSVSGESITVTTSGGGAWCFVPLERVKISQQQTKISYQVEGNYQNVGVLFYYNTTHMGNITWLFNGTIFHSGDTVTFPNLSSYADVGVVVYANNANVSATGTTMTYKNIQLELGTSVTSYEPYVGGTASPNPDYPQEVQTVTGEQTVTVASKNLLTNIANLNATDNGITNTLNADGSITCSGTVGNGWNGWNISGYVANSLPAGTYTFSIDQAISYDINVSFRDAANNTLDTAHITAGQTSATATISGQTARTSLWVAATTGTQIDFTISAMLEKGSLASSFVPYATQAYPVNLGKNLFDKDNANTLTGCYVDNDLRIVNTGNSTVSICYIKCEPNTTYTVQKENTGTNNRFALFTTATTPAAGVIALNLVGTNGAEDNHANYSITTPANAKYLGVFFAQPTGLSTPTSPEIMATIQIERGSAATTYAPYFTPIELCKIGTYQDYIYKSGEDWYIHKETGKVTFTGAVTETWSSATAATGYARFSTASGETHADNNGYCNEFINRGSQSHGAYEYVWVQPNANAFYIQVLNTRANDLAGFRTWLGANPATVYYDISTPTDTQITDATLISQLEALAGAKIMVDGGTATVTSQYLPATLTTAYNSNSGYIDYIYDGTNFVKVR